MNFKPARIVVIVLLAIGCVAFQYKRNEHTCATGAGESLYKDTVFKSSNLIVLKLSAHTYQHISYLTTSTWGKVNCNGMLVINDKHAVIFDTPATTESSEELINYVRQQLHCTITAVVPTHFHEDCIGGFAAFHKQGIPVYASSKTVALLKENENEQAKLMKVFHDSITLALGKQKVYVKYFGEGHTKDNVIAYFPTDSVLFGGCLIKELGANKGNLNDANTQAWPSTVTKLKQAYPQVNIVLPGHGNAGGSDLLDYTIALFK